MQTQSAMRLQLLQMPLVCGIYENQIFQTMIQKFKAIGLRHHNWIYGEDLYHHCGNVQILIQVGAFDVQPETVCQCIGAMDSEGNEIYEGDIVEYEIPQRSEMGNVITSTSACGIVFFNYETLAFCLRVKQGNDTHICSFASLFECEFRLKVIGNRFDERTRCSEKANN